MILLPGRGKQHEAGRKDGADQMTAYIWDLDGTLLDSYGVIVEGAARTSAEAGLQDTADEVLKGVKQGSVTEYLKGVSLRSGVPFAQLLAQYRLYAHGLDDRIILTDGAKETLERLRRRGAVHFVYTHRGSSSGPILERLGIGAKRYCPDSLRQLDIVDGEKNHQEQGRSPQSTDSPHCIGTFLTGTVRAAGGVSWVSHVPQTNLGRLHDFWRHTLLLESASKWFEPHPRD